MACPYCEFTSDSRSEMETHVEQDHGGDGGDDDDGGKSPPRHKPDAKSVIIL